MKKILDTQSEQYTKRLVSQPLWKSLLNVQAPYRWKLNSFSPGYTLEIGCGVGRNLGYLNQNSIGIDHNPKSVLEARLRGFQAFTESEFLISEKAIQNTFDTLLLSHVLEHLGFFASIELIKKYIPYLKPSGKVIIITPQEAGQESDPSHVELMDFEKIANLLSALNMQILSQESFPLPRAAGKFFPYNEFVTVGLLNSKP